MKMLRLVLVILLAHMYSCSMIPRCHIIRRLPGDDRFVPRSMCIRNKYSFSDGAVVRTPLPDCNICRCSNGVLKCCLYGIKSGPIAVPSWCEVHLINGTCEYELVFKSDQSRRCY